MKRLGLVWKPYVEKDFWLKATIDPQYIIRSALRLCIRRHRNNEKVPSNSMYYWCVFSHHIKMPASDPRIMPWIIGDWTGVHVSVLRNAHLSLCSSDTECILLLLILRSHFPCNLSICEYEWQRTAFLSADSTEEGRGSMKHPLTMASTV